MSGIASAFENSAKFIRNHDAITARRLITENIHLINSQLSTAPDNYYLHNMKIGYEAALDALYKIQSNKEKP